MASVCPSPATATVDSEFPAVGTTDALDEGKDAAEGTDTAVAGGRTSSAAPTLGGPILTTLFATGATPIFFAAMQILQPVRRFK